MDRGRIRSLAFALCIVPLVTGLSAWMPTASAADLVVSAASSLTNAFQRLGMAYEAKHPDTRVVLNFAASDVLMKQIVSGAPADVFASADQIAMDKAVSEKAVVENSRKNFATNQIVLIVPVASSLKVSSLKDLTQASVKRIAYGDPASVPVGRYTQDAVRAAGLWDAVSAKGVLAQNVRQSLDYVARDEVDAGFVFATDAAIMPEKVRVAMRVPSPVPVTYPIAITAHSQHAREAADFEAYVLSSEGQDILGSFGFMKP
jgi:molybdate transport system substrate-binding protein